MRKGLRLFKSFLFSAMLALVLVSCDPIPDPTSTDTGTDTTTDTSPTDTGGDEINEVSILAGWQDNLDTVYDPVVRDGALHMEFDKSGATWASAKKSLGAVSEDLADMTTLGIELAVEDYVGGGPKVFLLKIEFNDVAANPAREIKFKAKADKTTYEWDVSEYDLTDALQMLMFIDPGVGTTSGNAIFTTLSFAKTSVVEDPIPVGVPIDVVHNVYDSGDPFDVNKNFYDSGDLICDIETKAGVTTINYDKYGQEYAGAYMIAEGVQDFDYINVKIKGPATKSVLLEVQGGASAAAKEMVVFTGEVQEVTINFAEKTDRTGEQKLFVFIEPGVTAFSSGKIEISLLEYSSTPLVEVIEPDPIVHNIYEAGDPFDVNKNLYDGGDDVYDIVTDDGVTTLTYDKKVHSWASAYMIAEGVEGFDYFNIKIKGPVGKEAILKIEKDGAVEETIVFTGDVQDVTLNFGTKAVKTGEQTFRIFGEPGVEAVQGVIEISLLEYSSTALVEEAPEPDVHNIYEAGDPFDVNKNFYDGGDGVYDIETVAGVTALTYDKKVHSWASAYMIAEGVEGFDYFNIKIKGPVGKEAILKIEKDGAVEETIVFTGDVQDVTLDFGTKAVKTGEQTFRLFGEPGVEAVQGVIEISLLEYSSTALVQIVEPDPIVHNVYESGDPFDVNKNFYDGGDGVYDIETVADVTTLTYDKKGAEWASAYMIAEGVQDFDYVNVRIKGPDGKTAMLKNEGGGGNALEHVVSFDGTVQEVTIPFATKEIRTGEQKFLVFAEQGRGEGQGVIEISLLEYSSTALVQVVDPLNYYTGMNPWDKEWHLHKFVDGGDAVYDVDGKKVAWENQGVGGYQSVKALLDTNYRVAFTKFELIIEAAQAMKILVKVGAPLNIEKTLEFTAGNLTKGLVIDLSDKSDAQLKSINEILFFALFDNANPATGEFTITYAKFDSPRCAPVGDDAAPYIIGPSSYNINLTDNGTEIAWDSKGEWDAFGLPLEPGIDYSDVTKIEIKVSARTISELKVKINDDNAQQYDLEVSAYDDDVITLVATLHTPIDAIGTTFIIFFPDGGSSVAGHLTIVSINLIV